MRTKFWLSMVMQTISKTEKRKTNEYANEKSVCKIIPEYCTSIRFWRNTYQNEKLPRTQQRK